MTAWLAGAGPVLAASGQLPAQPSDSHWMRAALSALVLVAAGAAVVMRTRRHQKHRHTAAPVAHSPPPLAQRPMALHVLWVDAKPPSAVAPDRAAWAPSTCECATTAVEAVDALIRRRPDLIVIAGDLCDMAPGGLMRRIRQMQSDALESPSVILALAGAARDEEAAARDVGENFDGWIDEARSFEEVGRWLALLGEQRRSDAGIRFDPEVVLSMPGYIESRTHLAWKVDSSLRAGDRSGAAHAAHKLAGSPGIWGFDQGIHFYRRVAELKDNDHVIDARMLKQATVFADVFSTLLHRSTRDTIIIQNPQDR